MVSLATLVDQSNIGPFDRQEMNLYFPSQEDAATFYGDMLAAMNSGQAQPLSLIPIARHGENAPSTDPSHGKNLVCIAVEGDRVVGVKHNNGGWTKEKWRGL